MTLPAQIMRMRASTGVISPEVIHMQFDTGNGSTTFLDTGTGGSAWGTAAGAPVCSTTIVLSGVSSLFFPTNAAAISTPYTVANRIPPTGDWLISFLMRSSGWGSTNVFTVQDAAATGAGTVIGFASNAGGAAALIYSDGVTRTVVTGSTLTAGVINTYVVQRVGNTLSITENGVTMVSAAFAGSLNGVPSGSPVWRIGASLGAPTSGPTSSYLDNFFVAR